MIERVPRRRTPTRRPKVGVVFRFEARRPSAWTARPQERHRQRRRRARRPADCTLELAEADFLAMTQGKADPMKLFTTGKLEDQRQRDGVAEARVPVEDRPEQGDRGRREEARRAAAPRRAARPRRPARGEGRPERAEVLRGARQAPRREHGLAQRGPRDGDRSRSREPDASTDASTLGGDGADGDPHDRRRGPRRARGAATSRRLYQHGKLRVDGDVSVAHRLGFLKALTRTESIDDAPQGQCHRRRDGAVPEAGQERGVPRDGGEGRRGRARRREGPLQRGRSRRTPATSTATPRAASARSTSSASPASRCSTSTTTARPARPRSCSARRRSPAAWPSACSSSASSRWRRARSARSSTDRTNPLDKFVNVMNEVQGFNQAPPAAQMFGGAGREYRWKYGTKRETFAQDRREGAQARVEEPVRAVQGAALASRRSWPSPEVFDPLTRYQCCPPTCGAAAAVLCSDEFAKKHGIAKPGLHRGAGDDDRLPVDLRGALDDQDGRLRHGQGRARRRSTSRPASAPRTSTSSSCTTASPPTSCSPTRRSACARKARPRSSSGTATTPTAASSSRTRRAACSRRATRSARPASRSAPSSSGSSAARPTSARSRARRSRCSTTSASAAPA